MSRFWAQKVAIKKVMKFTLFIVYLLLKSHDLCKFHWFFKCNFLYMLIPPSIILMMCNKSIFTKFCLLPLFADFYITFTNFCHLLLFFSFSSANLFQFLPTFLLLFINEKYFCFFYFHLLTYTNPAILVEAMLQALILCLCLF